MDVPAACIEPGTRRNVEMLGFFLETFGLCSKNVGLCVQMLNFVQLWPVSIQNAEFCIFKMVHFVFIKDDGFCINIDQFYKRS